MSKKELQSYRLTSLEEPTDEMLQAVMEQVAVSARKSMASAALVVHQRLEAIRAL